MSSVLLRDRWRCRLTSPVAAGLVLALFWAGLLASLRNKGVTYDEIGHVTAGYSYWRYNDYRLDPENGNLPQRLMALPLVLGGGQFQFPPPEAEGWRTTDVWALGRQWFQAMGHDEAAMLFRGRAIMGLVAVALGALVWFWSRRLFGPSGGMLSLLLYVLSPIVLANGALMTSDTISAFFFLAAAGSLWAVAHRITIGRVLAGGLCLGGLCVAKMSAVLVVPVVLVLTVVRLIDGRPLVFAIGRSREIARRSNQAFVFAAVALVQVVIVGTVIWGFYGFRYGAFAKTESDPGQFQRRWEMVLGKHDPIELVNQLALSDGQRAQMTRLLPVGTAPREPWEQARLDAFEDIKREVLSPEQQRQVDQWLAELPRAWPARVVEFARRHELLPEAYLYGYANVWRFSGTRIGFLNGEISMNGDRWFFPYAFLVKTPLTMFAICGLALAAGVQLGRKHRHDPSAASSAAAWPALYDTLPLWSLLGIYWATVLLSHLNIGHRHLLPTYPPLLVLAGAAGYWLDEAGRASRVLAFALCGLMVGLVTEVFYRYPNYLAYFNIVAGGPAQGYRHLVDSSLDWGQDLPGVKTYLDGHPSGGPFYLSYFGVDDPAYYAISAARLYSAPGPDVPPPLFILTLPPDQVDATVANVQRMYPAYEVAGAIPAADHRVQVVMLENSRALRRIAGTYLISATMLQPLNFVQTGPMGPWNERFETTYQELTRLVSPLLSDNQQVRIARLREHAPAEWEDILTRFEAFRFGRLTAFLRRREPDDNINFSILVYHLGDADITQALQGPPPELGPDLPKTMEQDAGGRMTDAR